MREWKIDEIQEISRNERVVCIEYTTAIEDLESILFTKSNNDVIVIALMSITRMRFVFTAKCIIVYRYRSVFTASIDFASDV